MKKILPFLLPIILIFLLLSYIVRKTEFEKEYIVKNQTKQFQVKETYKNKQYFIEIENTFPIRIQSKQKNQNIIESIYYYENDQFQCLYPIGKNMPKSDVLCHHKDTIYPYQTIKGADAEIDQFVDSLEPYGYDKSQFEDTKTIQTTNKGITLYENLIKKHTIGIETYKGLILINQHKYKEKNIFTNDQYQKEIEQFHQSYYLVADYNQKYEFHEFYLINIENGKETKIISNQAISLDSYMQGVIDNKIYLLDRNHKKQYEIDIQKKSVKQIGDTNSGVQIFINHWETITMYQALKEEIYFTKSRLEEAKQKQYVHCDDTTLYTYCYQKTDTTYQVYRYDKEFPKIRYYITSIPNWKQVSYVDDYFYWKENDKIYYYQDNTNQRVALSNSEFTFNSDLRFGAYAK